MENVIFNSTVGIQLDWGLYDDFNDNSLDTTKWVKVENGGLAVTEDGGMLHMSGSYQEFGYWNSYCWAYSTMRVLRMCSADLMSFSGSGSGYSTSLMLYQDIGNYINIGRIVDYGSFGTNKPQLYWSYAVGGVAKENNIGDSNTGIHTYSIQYINETAYLFEDNTQVASTDINLVNPQMALVTTLRAYPDVVDVQWDNAKIDLFRSGNFTSNVFDTSSMDPVLKGVDWTSNTPAGTCITCQIRSSKKYDMTSPTTWTKVNRSQTYDLPALKEFIQYRITFNNNDGQYNPQFKNITIYYNKPIKKVEISIDNQLTWLLANGTDHWYIILNLPESTTRIWARVTDVAGNISLSSVSVVMDTVPPALTAVINNGENYTASQDINITINIDSKYPIDKIIISEHEDFSYGSWISYSDIVPYNLSEGEGQKIVYVKAIDIHGLESEVANATIELMTTPPEGSIKIDGGVEYTRNTTVMLSLNATSKVPIPEVLLSNNADFSGASWTSYLSNISWNILPGNGERTVYARFRDSLGLVSKSVNDTIILDTTPPSIQATIDDGSLYTRNTDVTLALNAADNYFVSSMQVSDNPTFFGSSWMPFANSVSYRLTGGDSQKTVYVRAADEAGNIGEATSASITQDSTPPSSSILQLPTVVTDTNFTVRWTGNDATSGIQFFDVQCREGAYTWTDWLSHVNTTSAVFNGKDKRTYSFRVRAIDFAGNLEKYPDAAEASVQVLVPIPIPPTISIVRPAANATVSGTIQIIGIAYHPEAGMKVVQVQVQIDNGEWKTAKGTDTWSFMLDTTTLSNDVHIIKVKAFDGTRYSNVSQLMISVDNQQTGIGQIFESPIPLIIVLVVIIASMVLAAIFLKRKKPPQQL